MSATAAPTSEASAATASLTKVQKLAALLLILSPDSAAQVLKNLDEEELMAVSTAMAEMKLIDAESQRALIEEFGNVAAGRPQRPSKVGGSHPSVAGKRDRPLKGGRSYRTNFASSTARCRDEATGGYGTAASF